MATGPDIAAAAVANAITHISLHATNPGTEGAGEVAGSGYVRLPVTLPAAVDGVSTATNVPLGFSGPPAGSCGFWGAWTAVSGGTFIDGGPLQGDTAFNSAGEFEITALSITVTRD